LSAGDVIRLDPVYLDGKLAGYAVINVANGELLMMVPKGNVTFGASAPRESLKRRLIGARV
jgi:hypothetical protein